MVGKIGRVKKVYPSFSEDSDNNIQPSYFYRVEVGGAVLKGIAASSDLEKVQKNDMKKYTEAEKLERIARDKLNMKKEGETTYKVIEK